MYMKVRGITGASPVFKVSHKVISLTSCLVYSLFQYIIGDGILLSWTGPCAGYSCEFSDLVNFGSILTLCVLSDFC